LKKKKEKKKQKKKELDDTTTTTPPLFSERLEERERGRWGGGIKSYIAISSYVFHEMF
jgi:hypothetical protein